MDPEASTAASLDALVAGKRAAPRLQVRIEARVKGLQGEYPCVIHDLSQDGALVAIPVAALGHESEEPLGPADQFALLEEHFRDSFDLQMTSCGVVVEAQVVRMVVTAEQTDDIALGCCFLEPLSEVQRQKLGLMDALDGELASWGDATLAEPLTHAADPARPVTALLSDGDWERAGPLHLGPVAAVGRRGLVLQMWGKTREQVVGQVREGVGVRILHGTKQLFAGGVSLVATRYIDTPRPGVEALFICRAKLPRAVRRLFRRA